MHKLSPWFAMVLLSAVLLACDDDRAQEGKPTLINLSDETPELYVPPTEPALGSPIPDDQLVPTTIMFCEPLTQGPGSGRLIVGVLPSKSELTVVYSGDGCFADIDASGRVAAVDESGANRRVAVEYVHMDDVNDLARIIWIPAEGQLDGRLFVMTGRFLAPDAFVAFDALSQPLAVFNATGAGRQVLGSLTERIVGLPLATFVNNEPLRGASGNDIVAPTVNTRIDETLAMAGASLDTAKLLVALVNSGNAR